MKSAIVVCATLLLSGCAIWSENSRPALLAGDVDFSLFNNRNSKMESKILEADGNNQSGSSVASPSGGGSIFVDPETVSKLLRASTLQMENQAKAESLRLQGMSTPSQPVKATKPSSGKYTVVEGDQLGEIARRFGVDVDRLMETNGLNCGIKPGQVLTIPE